MKTCLLASLTLATAMAMPSSAHAEMIPGLIRFSKATDTQTGAPGFRIWTTSGQTINDDPSADFVYTYAKSKSFLSLFYFERLLKTSPGGAILEFPMEVFLVNKGTVLTSATVEAGLASGKFKSFRYTGLGSSQTATVQRDFWLAMTIRKGPLNSVQPFKTFKWAHIRFNTAGVPEMVDSITAYNEPGLVVGEKTPCQAQACLEAAAP